MKSQVDRQLLLGLLALQCGFISKDQLVAAFGVWMSDKERSLDGLLRESQAISEQQQVLLSALIEEHLKQNGNDPERSLSTLSSVHSIKQALAELNDPDLLISLCTLPAAREDVYATLTVPSTYGSQERFVVLRPHARGGLGMVSIALDNELNRQVALKEILPQHASDKNSQSRFVQEAEITGQLEHPGIVPIYGLGNYADGRPFYAMRFVDGENLRTAITTFHRDRGPNLRLDGEKAIAFRSLLGRFIDVCHAIEYAHSRSVLHRDLKPDNILIGPYGETLVVDWGLAKSLASTSTPSSGSSRPVSLRSDSNETLDGSAVGTPSYMPPEQAMGRIQELGPAADIYSLGATLYSLLTGKPPVEGSVVTEVIEKVRTGDIRAPHEHWTAVPKALEKICLKAMAKEPQDRYPSARALAEDVERWLADEPVLAWKEDFVSRIGRFARRNRAWILSLIAFLGLASIVATVSALVINHYRLQEQAIRNVVQEMASEFQLAAVRSRSSELENIQASQPAAIELQQKKNKLQLALLDGRLTQALDPETRAWLHMQKGELLYSMGIGENHEIVSAREQFLTAAEIFRSLLKQNRSKKNAESLLASLRLLGETDQSLENDNSQEQPILEAIALAQEEIKKNPSEPSWELWLLRFNAMKAAKTAKMGRLKPSKPEVDQGLKWRTEWNAMEDLLKLPWPNDDVGRDLRSDSILTCLEIFASSERPEDESLVQQSAKTAFALIVQVAENSKSGDVDALINLIQSLQRTMVELHDLELLEKAMELEKRLADNPLFVRLKIDPLKKLLSCFNQGIDLAWQRDLRAQATEIARTATEIAGESNKDSNGDPNFAILEFDQRIRLADLLEEMNLSEELRQMEEKIVSLGSLLQQAEGFSKTRRNQWERHRDRIQGNPTLDEDPFKL